VLLGIKHTIKHAAGLGHMKGLFEDFGLILQACNFGVLYTASRTIVNAGMSVTEI
jgi:hypothetical protein